MKTPTIDPENAASSASSSGYIPFVQATERVGTGAEWAERSGRSLLHLDLFSGIGGFSIASRWAGFETVAFAEIEPDACSLLSYWYPDIPNLGDVRELRTQDYDRPDLLTGGVPCQPASLIGARRGTSDERWMWPDALGIVGELRPRFAVFENPPALLTLESGGAFNGIASELSALGYDLWWDVIPACAVGAGHIRERLLLVAADRDGERRGEARERLPQGASNGNDVWEQPAASHRGQATNGHDPRLERHAGNGDAIGRPQSLRPTTPESLRGVVSCPDWWREDVTGISVLVHGLPNRLAEAYHRCIGNAVVPQAVFPVINGVAALLAGGGGAERQGDKTPTTEKEANAKLADESRREGTPDAH